MIILLHVIKMTSYDGRRTIVECSLLAKFHKQQQQQQQQQQPHLLHKVRLAQGSSGIGHWHG